ncbi:MAG TPA: DUF4864 domain-containing protein [Capsulimonadaceae bacterium]|nr:DUF4864 domain-containing protein [Capsulimonadaceae bacterium]
MNRRIAPTILIFACFALGAIFFARLQATAGHYDALPDKMYPIDRLADRPLRDAAVAAVMGQLSAFRENSIDKAKSFESRMIMGSFVSTEDFRIYSTGDSPELLYYDRAVFGLARTDEMHQRVFLPASITGADKVTIKVGYMLIRDNDGVYRILGIRVGHRLEPGMGQSGPL